MMRNAIFDCDEKCNLLEGQKTATQQKLAEHFGSSLNNGVCGTMAKEIHQIKSPAAQTMVDNWHQSGAKSWAQWVNNSLLNDIRQHNQETFHELQNYQSQFTENIYAPLSQYLPSHKKFKGTANGLIKRILVMYNHLKLRNIPPNCCMQIDLRSRHDIIKRDTSNNEELEWNNDEKDEIYQADAKEEMVLPFKLDSNQKQRTAPTTSRHESSDDIISDESIAQIMNECVMPDDGMNCYKRYEALLYEKDVKVMEAISNNTIPECAFDNAPLCMIFNSTASVGEILNELGAETIGLITVSFHVYHRSLNVYVYVADDNKKLFGARVFGDDLISIIPLLFEYSKVDKSIMDELNNYFKFKPDLIYKQCFSFLLQNTVHQNECNVEERSSINPFVATKLEETVNSWNENDNKLIINTIKKCFVENNVNYKYFQNHKRKDLVQLLRRYQIKAAVATKIWRAFAGDPSANDNNAEHELKITPKIDIIANIMQKLQCVQAQNQMLLQKVHSLEQESGYLKRNTSSSSKEAAKSVEPEDRKSNTIHVSNGADIFNIAQSALPHNNNDENEAEAPSQIDDSIMERMRLLEQENADLKQVIENAISDTSQEDQPQNEADAPYPLSILTNLSSSIWGNSTYRMSSQLNKNGLAVNRGLHCSLQERPHSYQQGLGYLHYFRMVEEALFVLWILYVSTL